MGAGTRHFSLSLLATAVLAVAVPGAALGQDPDTTTIRPGDFYALIPPTDDIHRVRTTSPETSVSIHLLTNDTGCVWRHAYDAHSGEQTPFRAGYVNVICEDDG